MKKLPLSLVAASVSIVAAQAHANTEVNINHDLVDYSSVDDLTQAFHESAAGDFVAKNLQQLAKVMTLDNKKIDIDEDMLLAFNSRDATSTYGATSSTAMGCYDNCYNNCHGSRGWR